MFYTVKAQSTLIARLRSKAQCEAYVARIAKEWGITGAVISDKPEAFKGKHNEWCMY